MASGGHERCLFMQIGKRIENRAQHLSGLGWRERALGKDLREVLLRIFGDNVEQRDCVDFTAPL